ncbi:hypothetical protein [Nioella ostreopsis]|uniref:hypothetical protein n=1 Tax=Nioella ostreopsis TaxID=2448479 RepID=UPI000FDACD24|nr:hypothetical protein [Nioella ostreopsis]
MTVKTLGSVLFLAAIVPEMSQAQEVSVLERVLGTIDNATNLAPVNGVYANIAENIGSVGNQQSLADPSATDIMFWIQASNEPEEGYVSVTYGDLGQTVSFLDYTEFEIGLDGSVSVVDIDDYTDPYTIIFADGSTEQWDDDTNQTFDVGGASVFTSDILFWIEATDELDEGRVAVRLSDVGQTVSFLDYTEFEIGLDGSVSVVDIDDYTDPYTIIFADGSTEQWDDDTAQQLRLDEITTVRYFIPQEFSDAPFLVQSYETTFYAISSDINGSINNTISGVVEATALATASLATATELTIPTLDFADMATTALGAVNTGEITLGVNSAVDEAATTYTNAISAALTQIGGSVDTGAVVINVASNMSAVDGSINNVLNQVNGSIGNLSTTALGAVNTGTIVSGVDAAVQGIVGMSGQ